jgi:hypothetical protein
MAQSYQLIGAVTVGSGGATNIEFTSISQAYTDLFLVTSLRCTTTQSNNVIVTVNGSSSSYTDRYLVGTGSATASGTATAIYSRMVDSSFTANTFSNSSLYISNYTNSNYKSFSTDAVEENNASNALMGMASDLWSNTAAITSITLTPGSGGNIAQYSTAYLYGIGGTRASGGTITADGNYTYHTFTSTGTFTALERIRGAEALVIAGGGGGAISGGGAGGVFYTYGQTLAAGNSYAVVVGSGGAAGTSGSNSTIASFVATGGGTGGYNGNGGSGGSGGGAGTGTATTYTGGSSTQSSTGGVGYGFAGGNATASSSGNEGGAGGGGGGSVGQNMPGAGRGSNGGAGLSVFHSWHYATSTGVDSGGIRLIAGGGGGSGKAGQGTGGTGGGGNAGNPATNGTANTGGGGGGNVDSTSGSGGSGLVIIRYPNS